MNGERFWKLWERFGLLAVILIGIVVLSISSPNFLAVDNFRNFLTQAAVVAIVGAGMTFAIAAGGFDLSVGAVFSMAACVGANVLLRHSVPLSLLASLGVGLGLGLLNGLIITKLKVPAFIATLGMMAILRGVILIYTQGRDINIIIEPARQARYKFLGGGQLAGVPTPILIMAALFLIYYVVLRHTRFGRHVCAVGSNEPAARSSGLNVDRIKATVFGLVGLSAAIAAVIQTAQLMGVSGGVSGLGLELEAISVVVLGGTSLNGGRARLFGTMLAAILVAMANNGLNLHNTPSFYQDLALGLILLFAVSIDGLRTRFQKSFSRLEAMSGQ